jgi:hypothetical protein
LSITTRKIISNYNILYLLYQSFILIFLILNGIPYLSLSTTLEPSHVSYIYFLYVPLHMFDWKLSTSYGFKIFILTMMLLCCRYFSEPDNMVQKAHHDAIFSRIVNDSITFHFWNGITSALVPEPSSLVSKILNRYCIRCLDVL